MKRKKVQIIFFINYIQSSLPDHNNKLEISTIKFIVITHWIDIINLNLWQSSLTQKKRPMQYIDLFLN